MVSPTQRLEPAQLRRQADLSWLDFETTDDLSDITEVVGQHRGVTAIRFGLGMKDGGFNIYALGPSGLEMRELVKRFFAARAEGEPVPSDWCYVHNFAQDHRPVALSLPAGRGRAFRSDMESLVQELQNALSAAFESEEYQTRRQGVTEAFRDQQAEAFETLQERASREDVALVRTPGGIAMAPMREGEVLSREQILELSEEEQKAIEEKVERLQDELQRIMQQVPRWQRSMRERMTELNREMAGLAVGALIEDLRQAYESLPQVVDYLNAVQEDVVENAEQFLPQSDPEQQGPMARLVQAQGSSLARYSVNLLIDNADLEGAPVVYEDNPTFPNLVGRVEHRAQMGALMTDFRLIKPGALLRANGGYLILDARSVLMQPYAWDALKRALKGGEVRIESLGQQLSVISTVSLEPAPIPLAVKVALIGPRDLYYMLAAMDPEFSELFKVAADFDDQMAWDRETESRYAQLLATMARREELLPFDRDAVEALMERSARITADSKKLTTRMREIGDLMLEADYWAKETDAGAVTGDHVRQALEAQIERVSRIRDRSQESIVRETKLIDTEGAVVGQINGLSVYAIGNHAFGQPTRITARTSLGQGQVVDIEREVELGGPLHSKGMLILTGFLTSRYAQEQPLSLSASLVFEQSYGGVDGDSASSAELYALLSAIAEAPIKQAIAVTGSVNQRGEVQAIGGVNEKIEGFFDLCKARGLTGEQGVMIPASNVKHLMLRQDIVDAVAGEQFHIYAASHIDQGIETLTGVPAGEPDEEGAYPEDTINGRVQRRLRAMAEKLKAFAKTGGEDTSE